MDNWDYHIVNVGMSVWSRICLLERDLEKEVEDDKKDILKREIEQERTLFQKEIEYFLKWNEVTTALDYASK